jgi:hypothetical protein
MLNRNEIILPFKKETLCQNKQQEIARKCYVKLYELRCLITWVLFDLKTVVKIAIETRMWNILKHIILFSSSIKINCQGTLKFMNSIFTTEREQVSASRFYIVWCREDFIRIILRLSQIIQYIMYEFFTENYHS